MVDGFLLRLHSYGRNFTFFDQESDEIVHIDFSYPFSRNIRDGLINAANDIPISINYAGTYGCTQGPRLETAAEIKKLKQDGCTMVGMTAMPEASLAREKEMDYASIAVSANWAAGIQNEAISMDMILQHLNQGITQVNQIISRYIKNL